MNTVTREDFLTDDEILIIKKQRNLIVLILILAAIIADASLIFLSWKRDFTNTSIICTFITLFFCIVIYFMFLFFKKDLNSGKKLVTIGILTDKKITGGKTSGYFFVFDDIRVYVKKDQYLKFSVGEKLEIHYTFNSKTTLFIKSY